MKGQKEILKRFNQTMAEDLIVSTSANKSEKYQTLIPQLEALVMGERDVIANLANITAALKQTMNFFWVGFYVVREGQLVLGPFQGPVACTRIDYGKGVCGAAWKNKETIIVPDVDQFPGHIACSSASRSEIVLPVFKNNEVVMVLDVDSDKLNDFDDDDSAALAQVIRLTESLL
jgi:GAF domain-containing protein